jgi:hypothetical protein
MTRAHGSVASVLVAFALWYAEALGADMAVSRDVEVAGDDVAGQLQRPVADMEHELAQQGCVAFSRAYWSDTTPLRTIHVEVRCKEGNEHGRLSLR